ncbi:DUF4350 domain-containing protein [Amniculibacterium sp. G2-70]|jgi:hypothetical protein|uniref:DUF4350 domain-containing protein n=1 Tax=Amniculibacterium sp. G2-70 TaxID=2767188 RepID=UPI0016548D83|nr:DUF4350 domain-containing protein [Amniculibacterium sp. G2-70]
MNKTFKLYGIIFLVVFALLAFFELGKKEITDWRKNFDINQKTPFGLFVFDHEIDALLHNKVQRIKPSPYHYYTENPKNSPHTILVIQKHLDAESWKKILNQIHSGSDAMIIDTEINKKIQDSLNFVVEAYYNEEQSEYEFTDKKLSDNSLKLDKFPGNSTITHSDLKNEILGKIKVDSTQWNANFIKINFGKGHIYYHSDPTFLTNYYLLKPNGERYTEGVFSYLKDQKTLWFVDNIKDLPSTSPLSFILKNPPLKYAWWLFLGGLLVFAIFGAKRKQRIIPVMEPLKNKSVEFVQSIGNLYLQEGDFHDMMAKKAQYFLYRVKMELLIDPKNLDDAFVKKLQSKTGKDFEKIKQAKDLIAKALDPYAQVNREDFEKMNALLDEIHPHIRK